MQPALELLLSLDATKSMCPVLIENDPQNIVLMIGPESDHSIETAQTKATDLQIVLLDEQVLRTETLGIVAITALHSIWNPAMQNRLK